MRINKLLLTAFLGGSFLTFNSSAVMATGSVRLVPVTNWTISKVNSKSDTGDYCTMARRFSNDLVLTMARNIGGETSLAVDFQRNVLDSGKTYTVILSAGATSRAFDVKPVSTKAFVIRTGSDEQFYVQAEKHRYIDVSFSGMSYRFGIKDLVEGNNHLGACVASLYEPAAGGSVANNASSSSSYEGVTSDALARERAGLLAMQDELRKMQSENVTLSEQLKNSRLEYENQMRAASGSAVVFELNEKLDLLERENSSLRKSLDEYQIADAASASKDGRSALLEQEIEKLVKVNEDLRTRLDAVGSNDSSMKEVATLQSEKENLELQKNVLQAQLEEAKAESESHWRQAKADLDAKVMLLEKENGELEASLSETRSALDFAKSDLVKTGSTSAKVIDLEGRLASIVEEKLSLESELDSLRDEAAAMDDVRADLEEMRVSLAKEQKTNASLLADIDRLKMAAKASGNEGVERTLSEKIASLEEKNRELYSAFETAKLQLLQKDADNDAEKAKLDEATTKVASLENKLEELRQKNRELEGRLEYMQVASEDSGKENVVKQEMVAQLRTEVEKLTAVNAGLQKELIREREQKPEVVAGDIERQNQIVSQLRGKVDSLIEENAGLKTSLEDARKTVEEKAAEASNVGKLLSDVAFLKTKLAEAEASNKALNDEISRLKEAKESMASLINTDKSAIRLAEAEKEIRRLGGILKKDREQCSIEIEHMESQLFDPVLAGRAQIDKVESLKRSLAVASDTSMECNRRMSELKLQLDESREKLRQVAKAEGLSAANEAVIANAYNRIETGSGAATPSQYSDVAAEAEVEGGESFDSDGAVQLNVSAGKAVVETVTAEVIPETSPFMTPGQIVSVLNQAGFPIGAVQKIKAGSGSMVAYRWDSNGVYGTAEQKRMAGIDSFEPMVTAYLDQAEDRCHGDFAAISSHKIDGVDSSAAAYEIACVSGDMDSSASLLFLGDGSIFTTVAHETSTDKMDLAMDFRDGMMKVLSPVIEIASSVRHEKDL